jgi:predicted secreted protein
MTVPARLLVVALLLVGGCGGGEPPGATDGTASGPPATTSSPGASPTRPAPRTVTPTDDGARFTMAEGTTTTLRVQDQSAPDPVVEGAAVLLVPIVNITDSGAREWELRAVAPGTSTVTGRDPDYSFVVIVT